jgi:hypothetical protein
MARQTSRRSFLRDTAVAGAAWGLSETVSAWGLPPVSAAEATPRPGMVRLQPEIEPLVRLLEDSPRDRLLEEVAVRLRRGTSYQQIVAALMLAGVRNIQPRPSVGFKFHAVLVVNSAHLASLGSCDADRWLPIFWALDYFKDSQARDEREGNWTMQPVDEAAVPPAAEASRAFQDAMQRWDEAAADAAVAALARSAGANEVFELFYRYGCRDFRSIGHKAIYVANAQRTLGCIGWQHAEPVLRSLAYALLNHEGEPNPAEQDLEPDAIGKRNQQRVAAIRPDWLNGGVDDAAAAELLDALRGGTADDACDRVVALLNRGVGPQSIWDAVLTSAGELVMRQPGIVALHAVTSSNALHYAFRVSGDDAPRRMLLLQNVAFLRLFHQAMQGRGAVSADRCDALAPADAASDPDTALQEIFADVSADPKMAARKVLAFLRRAPAEQLVGAARRLVFLKGNDAHDYKFSSAVLEDYYALSPAWRDRYLALSVFKLRGSSEPDHPLVERTRKALLG